MFFLFLALKHKRNQQILLFLDSSETGTMGPFIFFENGRW
jgi:hypothetical protein